MIQIVEAFTPAICLSIAFWCGFKAGGQFRIVIGSGGYWREAYEALVRQTGRDLNDGLGADPRRIKPPPARQAADYWIRYPSGFFYAFAIMRGHDPVPNEKWFGTWSEANTRIAELQAADRAAAWTAAP